VEGPFRIIYYIKPDQIDVLAVIHGAQQIPPSNQ
jgi:plasmid stabilization system protein ParE